MRVFIDPDLVGEVIQNFGQRVFFIIADAVDQFIRDAPGLRIIFRRMNRRDADEFLNGSHACKSICGLGTDVPM